MILWQWILYFLWSSKCGSTLNEFDPIPVESVERAPPVPLEKPQRDIPQQEWDRKSVTPYDRLYLDSLWKIQSMPQLQTPVLHAPYPTFGMVMPLPFAWSATERFYPVDADRLKFAVSGVDNYVISSAVNRCRQLIKLRIGLSPYAQHWSTQESQLSKLASDWLSEDSSVDANGGTAGTTAEFSELSRVPWFTGDSRWIYELFAVSAPTVKVTTPLTSVLIHVKTAGADWPSSNMDESYAILVDKRNIYLFANETWGALRGLESLTQLLWRTQDQSQVFVNQTFIFDKPRFPHRGLLVDTARHYISKSVLLINLEAMAHNKMNVFHWHLVDDNSFPFQSQTFPELSGKGAFHPRQVYTASDIREIVEFARLRGIRVIPEYDIPGHTRSLAYSKPELLSQCADYDSGNHVYFGPLNVLTNETYDFLEKIITELTTLFPDEYVHLGGDEVETVCWDADLEMAVTLRRLRIKPNLMDEYFWRRVQNLVTEIGSEKPLSARKLILWEDVFSRVLEFQSSLVMHLWKPNSDPDPTFKGSIIYSSCWYLDQLADNRYWDTFYTCDPHIKLSFTGLHNSVIGGEACMWSEYQSDDTILARIWPVTSAVAERLWSPFTVRSLASFGPRVEEQRCREMSRGIPQAVLLGPGSCEFTGAFMAFEGDSLREQVTGHRVSTTSEGSAIPTSQFFSFIIGFLFGILLMLCTSHRHASVLFRQWIAPNRILRRVSIVRLLALALIVVLGTFFILIRSQQSLLALS